MQSPPTQSEPALDALPANEAPTLRAADLKNDTHPNGQSSVGKRASITLLRFLIIFCIGASAAFAWQSYGAPVRDMIASTYPQLNWLAPQSEPVPQNVPDAIALASRTAFSPDHQQPNAILLDLDAVRQSIDRIATSIASSQGRMTSSADRIATSQQQIAESLDRIATSQEQMTREITKLEEIEQSNSSRNSELLPRPVSASAAKPLSRPAAAKPVPRPASTPTDQPLSRASQEPPAAQPLSRASQEPPAAQSLFRGPSQEPTVR